MTSAWTSLRRPVAAVLAAGGLLGVGAAAAWTVATAQTHQHGALDKGGWLVKLAPAARTEAIERQFRGFETTMAKVAYRYGEMYWGRVDGNWGYGVDSTDTAPLPAGRQTSASPRGRP